MGCSSCETKNGLPKGCKNNGACGENGCSKLPVFDWLSNMKQPVDSLEFNYVEVRFKNDRKEFFQNIEKLPLHVGDIVAVEASPGHDIGVVTMLGELVRVQMQRKNVKEIDQLPKIYRKANEKDVDTWVNARGKEEQTKKDARRIAKELGLDMKIGDVEYQGDDSKVTFYYTAEGRVDFRQLIRSYASAFKTRIEMRQIGYRQEAAKLGGIGSCGRELCCSTWLTDFRSVSTSAARYQQLSINPQKIAGQCGKLKCCLNFELDSYLDALNHFPQNDVKVHTKNGSAQCVKIDVFKKELWFSYIEPGNSTWYKFNLNQVNDFITINKKGDKIDSLEDLDKQFNATENIFNKDVIEDNSLKRFENKRNKRRKKRKPSNHSKHSNKQKNNRSESKQFSSNKKRNYKKKPQNKSNNGEN